MKKRIFLAAVLICCLALAGGGTLAYYTARATAYNVITTGELDMTLMETKADGSPYPDEPVFVMPSHSVDKVVFVKNTGGVDFYTRIGLTFILTDENGKTDTLTMKDITLDFDTQNWTKQGDYYYYNRALCAMGEDGTIDATEPLFTTVTFEGRMSNAYQNATLEIIVDAQAVQSRNNTDSPLTAAGWDAN